MEVNPTKYAARDMSSDSDGDLVDEGWTLEMYALEKKLRKVAEKAEKRNRKIFDTFIVTKDGMLLLEDEVKRFTAGRKKIETLYARPWKEWGITIPDAEEARDDAIYETIFKMYDVDNSGQLDMWEFEAVVRDLDFSMNREDLRAVFHDLDEDDSGSLDIDEVRDWYHENKAKAKERRHKKKVRRNSY